ncbi:hypothetical protein CPB84DRAFT_1788521 [Gymnopilus junonius]|uniref:Uncharacterized protein n=1 Tax=Gymnopilus junonius TaxID=109634 RepID=A0A9P5NEA0_GYMJU|nr:hypothetical protein CPB84DRAFT_1788521 [Gymnopilus junonius]
MHKSIRVLSNLAQSKTLLPGFGRPLTYEPNEQDPDYVGRPFPSVLRSSDWRHLLPLTTLRELTMLRVMNAITDKVDWRIKIKKKRFAMRWKQEILNSGLDVTEKMANWCMEELVHKARMVPNLPAIPPPVFVYNGDVFKWDKFSGSAKLKADLQKAVRKFEEKIPENMKDWHPNSGGKVWDLVHPSLFPLVYGRTRILANGEMTDLKDCIPRCGQGEIIPVPQTVDPGGSSESAAPSMYAYSAKFQWLPCEVDITGRDPKITSYINNLHPHTELPLYSLIEKVIKASISLWEKSLAPYKSPKFKYQQRIKYNISSFDPPEPRGRNAFNYIDKKLSWEELPRHVVLPEPSSKFKLIKRPPPFSLKAGYRKKGLQVIVKLANIQLTPDKPDYNGGTWHVEGQMNEHIVATSLYYYDCHNVTPSALYFRQLVDDDTVNIRYPQDVHDWLPAVFGVRQNGPGLQEVGGVETREGRLLSFPNILQHRVGPFKLRDPTRPGHRKVLALFLVDPNIKIISTAHVPCQRQDWWQEWKEAPPKWIKQLDTHVEELSQSHTLEQANFPISLKEAEELRLELMDERKEFVLRENDALETDNVISLCEH